MNGEAFVVIVALGDDKRLLTLRAFINLMGGRASIITVMYGITRCLRGRRLPIFDGGSRWQR